VEASPRTHHARELFAPLGPTYDRYARVLSFGQDPRWRTFLVSRVPRYSHRVLDVATGTAAVAIELARAEPTRAVVGIDQSPEMLARVVRPGGTAAMLEFGLPRGVWRQLWELYVRVGLPSAGALVAPGWAEVGRFLGPSIRDFWRRWPEPRLLDAWREAGMEDVQARRLSLGGGLVVWGRRA
jgi:demethylmenaquinone methyltransferase / 2-methoxy-6-polyprenyl-1,4-benzoquinol methylase